MTLTLTILLVVIVLVLGILGLGWSLLRAADQADDLLARARRNNRPHR
jgi:hypothetical protein